MNFSIGWGKETITFSMPEEHRVGPAATLTILPKLEKQWRIIHDFKPVSYERHVRYALALCKEGNVVMSIAFNSITTVVKCISEHWPKVVCNTGGVPRLGEWTTIEIFNEEEEMGKCTFSVIIGGKRVFREDNEGSRDLTDVCVRLAPYSTDDGMQQGYIRRLSIMTKK